MSVSLGSPIESADEPQVGGGNSLGVTSGRMPRFLRHRDHETVILDRVSNNPGNKSGDRGSRPAVCESAKTPSAEGLDVRPRHLSKFLGRTKIGIKLKGRILLIDAADIAAVEAQGNYSLLRRRSDSYLVRASISTLAQTLAPLGFVQIHRSVLVNVSWVEELRPWVTGEYVLRLEKGHEYTVSRRYRNNLKMLAEAWVGADYFAG